METTYVKLDSRADKELLSLTKNLNPQNEN